MEEKINQKWSLIALGFGLFDLRVDTPPALGDWAIRI